MPVNKPFQIRPRAMLSDTLVTKLQMWNMVGLIFLGVVSLLGESNAIVNCKQLFGLRQNVKPCH